MDAGTLQAALVFHRLHVRVLAQEMRARQEASARTVGPNARETPRCPRPWCRNPLKWNEALRVWECTSCDYRDMRRDL